MNHRHKCKAIDSMNVSAEEHVTEKNENIIPKDFFLEHFTTSNKETARSQTFLVRSREFLRSEMDICSFAVGIKHSGYDWNLTIH